MHSGLGYMLHVILHLDQSADEAQNVQNVVIEHKVKKQKTRHYGKRIYAVFMQPAQKVLYPIPAKPHTINLFTCIIIIIFKWLSSGGGGGGGGGGFALHRIASSCIKLLTSVKDSRIWGYGTCRIWGYGTCNFLVFCPSAVTQKYKYTLHISMSKSINFIPTHCKLLN